MKKIFETIPNEMTPILNYYIELNTAKMLHDLNIVGNKKKDEKIYRAL